MFWMDDISEVDIATVENRKYEEGHEAVDGVEHRQVGKVFQHRGKQVSSKDVKDTKQLMELSADK